MSIPRNHALCSPHTTARNLFGSVELQFLLLTFLKQAGNGELCDIWADMHCGRSGLYF